MEWVVRESNPGKDKTFRSFADRPWLPPSLLYNPYRLSFLGIELPRSGADHLFPPSSEVKGRVYLHLYFSSGFSWHVMEYS